MRRTPTTLVSRTCAALLAALLLAACAGDLGQQATGEGTRVPGVRQGVFLQPSGEREPLPDLPAYPLLSDQDQTAALADLEGDVAVINFWASWCGPCRAEQPDLNAAVEELEGEPVSFLGVNFRDDPVPNAQAHVREFAIPYDSLYDPENTIAAALDVTTIPATVVLDARGRIAGRLLGVTTTDEVVAFARRLAEETG